MVLRIRLPILIIRAFPISYVIRGCLSECLGVVTRYEPVLAYLTLKISKSCMFIFSSALHTLSTQSHKPEDLDLDLVSEFDILYLYDSALQSYVYGRDTNV
jgi:hypothetical protein